MAPALHLDTNTWVFIAVTTALFLAFVCFCAFIAFFKKPRATISGSSLMNTSPDDSFDNHERKRLLAWMYQKRFTAEISKTSIKPVSFDVGTSPLPLSRTSSLPPIKSPPQIFTSTLHSKSLSTTTHIHDRYFTPLSSALNISPQLPTISPDALKSVWESNSSLSQNHTAPPKAKMEFRTQNAAAMIIKRTEAYIQGSRIRDSLDVEAQGAKKRANIVDNRFL